MSLMDRASCAADGSFVLDGIHPTRAMDLACEHMAGQLGEASVEAVPPGSSDVLIVIERMAAGGDRIGGRVVDAAIGQPITRFEVAAAPWSQGPHPWSLAKLAVEDVSGRFLIKGLDGTASRLFVEAVGYPAQDFGPFTPGPDADVELRLGRHATLAVRVIDASGACQPGASVQLTRVVEGDEPMPFGDLLAAVARTDGSVEWTDLTPGAYTLQAACGDLRAPRQRIQLPPGLRTPLDVTLRPLPDSGALEITALDKDGAALAGAVVRVTMRADLTEGDALPEPYVGVTLKDGRVRLGGLPPGSCLVMVTASDVMKNAFGEATVIADQTAHITVRATR